MIVADLHCDTIAEVFLGNSGLVNEYNISKRFNHLQTFALFCDRETEAESNNLINSYFTAFEAALLKEKDLVVKVTTYKEIETAFLSGRHAALISTEGGMAYKGDVRLLTEFYKKGVRIVGLAWLSNRMVKSNIVNMNKEEDTGLSPLGRDFIEEGNRLGIIFDVSHLSDKSFYDIAEIAEKPLIATHSNFRTVCGHSRNLTDDMAKIIVDRNGIIGLNLYPDFVADIDADRTVDGLFRQLDYGLEHFGENNICFGFDIDGCGGRYPQPIDTSSSIHDRIIDMMLSHGYKLSLIEKTAGGNFLSYLKKYL